MPRTCSVCAHYERHAINLALVRREPYRTIADRHGLSQTSLKRHSQDHIPQLLLKAYEGIERDDAEGLLGELSRVKADVHRLKERAEEEGDLRTALAGCDKALKALELQAKVEQLIQTSPTLNLRVNPEYLEVRALIVQALDPYPDARMSVVRALQGQPLVGSNGAH